MTLPRLTKGDHWAKVTVGANSMKARKVSMFSLELAEDADGGLDEKVEITSVIHNQIYTRRHDTKGMACTDRLTSICCSLELGLKRVSMRGTMPRRGGGRRRSETSKLLLRSHYPESPSTARIGKMLLAV